MRFCLTCHADQGIASTLEMRSFVRSKQAELASLEEQCLEQMTLLKEQIIAAAAAGNTPQPALDAARAAFADAWYYYYFQRASAELPGTKVAHNPDVMRSLLTTALTRTDEGSAALQGF